MKLSLVLYSFSVLANKITINVTLTPAGSFQAVSNKPKGNVIKTADSFTADKISVSTESFKTGIDLRDEHTWKHLNSTKHPKAILSDVKGQGLLDRKEFASVNCGFTFFTLAV